MIYFTSLNYINRQMKIWENTKALIQVILKSVNASWERNLFIDNSRTTNKWSTKFHLYKLNKLKLKLTVFLFFFTVSAMVLRAFLYIYNFLLRY